MDRLGPSLPHPGAATGRSLRHREAMRWIAVHQAATSLASIPDEEVLYAEILREAALIVPSDSATLCILDPEGEPPRIVASRGDSGPGLPWLEETTLASMSAVAGGSARGLPSGIGTSGPASSFSRDLAALPGRNLCQLNAPIRFGGEHLGMLALGAAGSNAFSPEDRRLLFSFANHCGIALSTARLRTQVKALSQSKLRDLTNLSQIGQAIGASLHPATVLDNIVRSTVEAFNSSGSGIVLLNDGGEDLAIAAMIGMGPFQVGRQIPLEGTASGWIVRHRQSLLVPSVADTEFEFLRRWYDREGVKSFIGVPLITQDRAIGSLNLYSRSGQRFKEGDIQLLEGLAAQAAIAINHASLYESVAREKAKLEAIVESLQEGLVLVSADRVIVYASQRFVDLLGLDIPLVAGSTIDRIWRWLVGRCSAPTDIGERLKSLESDISQSINLVLAKPQSREVELQSFRVGAPDGSPLGRGYLARDVTQQAEVERLKASILSTVSHELRSPLSAIKGFSSSLLRTDVEWDPASKRDFVEQIDREADRLGMLVRKLLDMSRLDAGALRLDREWCDLGELVGDIIARMAPVVGDHRVDLVERTATLLAFVDRRYLERVVWNLIENAAKYSPGGSKVTVTLSKQGKKAVLRVADEGNGIDPEERDRIFQRFYRGARIRTPGVGLGLAICRGIVEAHGGTIAADNRREGGAVFSVWLPGD